MLLVSLLLLALSLGLAQAQCPPNVTSVFILNDRTINVPLTEPLCLQCRFLDIQTGNFLTFSDGVWRKGSDVLNDDGNIDISSTSNPSTIILFMTNPDAVVNVNDALTCASPSTSQHIVTLGPF
uniref:Ig-like domain-containing protein n=1 Tax=Amphimedon queenslandica TaxID=400682 RepID=A0A1X7UZE6_AMPQE